ncbi:acyltransferase [Photobacterium damselae]|uniref:acyltransferase n=1 Tax=Photobacterium damselae TaxID=38293 RepID=UPI00254338BA|nr:acyltransferase [Photobacterium damselae]WIH20118.1 acyltransferase [Photobacterium damselae]
MLNKIIFLIVFILSKFPVAPGFLWFSNIRICLFKLLGAKIGKKCVIGSYAEIHNSINFSMAEDSGVGTRSFINCADKVSIGSRVLMGPDVSIFSSNHKWNEDDRTYYKKGVVSAPVIINDDCWLGAKSIILPGVVLGKGVTVCAGAVVNKSFPDYAVIGGVPAKIIKIKSTS